MKQTPTPLWILKWKEWKERKAKMNQPKAKVQSKKVNLTKKRSTTFKTQVSDRNFKRVLGINYMCKHLGSLDDFAVEKLTPNILERFFMFLQTPEYTKFFVWIDTEVQTHFDAPPPFFGNLNFLNFL